jgi:hypothetical protein
MKSNFIHFQLLGKNYPVSVQIANRHTVAKPLLHNGKALRYVENMEAVYEKDQDPQAEKIIKPIYIEDGSLLLNPSRQANLIEFLRHHPDNKANGGALFFERNFQKEAEEALAYMDMEDRARDLARDLKGEEARMVHRMLFPERSALLKDMDGIEVTRELRQAAKYNPATFLEVVGDEEGEAEHNNTVETALELELIQFRKNQSELYYNLKNSKKMITRVPAGADPVEFVKDFLLEKEGLDHLAKIETAIADIRDN